MHGSDLLGASRSRAEARLVSQDAWGAATAVSCTRSVWRMRFGSRPADHPQVQRRSRGARRGGRRPSASAFGGIHQEPWRRGRVGRHGPGRFGVTQRTYILLIGRTIEKSEAEHEEMSEESSLALKDAVDCLATIGDSEAVAALGALIPIPSARESQPTSPTSACPMCSTCSYTASARWRDSLTPPRRSPNWWRQSPSPAMPKRPPPSGRRPFRRYSRGRRRWTFSSRPGSTRAKTRSSVQRSKARSQLWVKRPWSRS